MHGPPGKLDHAGGERFMGAVIHCEELWTHLVRLASVVVPEAELAEDPVDRLESGAVL